MTNANRICEICHGKKKLRHQDRVLEDDFNITEEYLVRIQDCYYCLGRGEVCKFCSGHGYVKRYLCYGYETVECERCKGDGFCKELISDLALDETQRIV